jgi:hypothetical protein
MNPILVIGVVFTVLLGCGVVFDLVVRRRRASSHDIGLAARTSRGIAESQGGVGGADIQGRYGGPGL